MRISDWSSDVCSSDLAVAEPRRHTASQRARIGLVGEPVQTIGELDMAAGAVRFVGNPHGADVVVDLVVGRNLHELHHAAAPIAQWLDPGGRPQVVTDAVEVVIEVAVALRQAERSDEKTSEHQSLMRISYTV